MFDPRAFLNSTYSRDDIINSLETLGVEKGDTVLVHSSLFALGLPSDNVSNLDMYYYKVLREYIGADGTLVFPAFTYSYCKGHEFNVKESLSSVSSLANYCIKEHIGYRSADALFSYVIDGPQSSELAFSNVCFDIEDGVAGYLLGKDAKVLMLGVGFAWLTAFYSIDQKLKVPYRFFKEFKGVCNIEGIRSNSHFYYFCRALVDNTVNDNDRIDSTLLHHSDKVRSLKLGAGIAGCSYLSDLFEIFEYYVKKDPWYFLNGPEIELDDMKDAMIEKELYKVVKL